MAVCKRMKRCISTVYGFDQLWPSLATPEHSWEIETDSKVGKKWAPQLTLEP